MDSKILTQSKLKELLYYSPQFGIFVWRKSRGRAKEGNIAGTANNRGYISIVVSGERHQAHRLAFFYMNGEFPPEQTDHIDGNPKNNAWSNLRHATSSQNNRNRKINSNNTSGYFGVSWHKHYGKWTASITGTDGVKYLGYFSDISDAIKAREAAEVKYEYHKNHGRTSID